MATSRRDSNDVCSALQSEHIWNISSFIDLPRNFSPPLADLFEILEKRRSRRTFNEIGPATLSTLLWFSQRHTGTFPGPSKRVSTPVPTFGGLASVRTLVLQPDLTCWIYDPTLHRSGIIEADNQVKKSIRREAGEFFSMDNGIILLFAASRSYVDSFYTEPENLVLREAGVVTGTMALIAEALNLAFCPLGTSGGEWLYRLLNATEQIIIPGGATVIGNR